MQVYGCIEDTQKRTVGTIAVKASEHAVTTANLKPDLVISSYSWFGQSQQHRRICPHYNIINLPDPTFLFKNYQHDHNCHYS